MLRSQETWPDPPVNDCKREEINTPLWLCLQCWRPRHIPWRREWMAAHSGFLPGEVHEQRSPVKYSSWGRKELDMTERLSHFPEADGNQEVFDFTLSPFSIKRTWILTQAPLVFGAQAHHPLGLLAFWIKPFYWIKPISRPNTLSLDYWRVVQGAVWA